MHFRTALVCLGLVLSGCGGKGASSPASQGGGTLIGRWTAQIPGAACSYDVELMDGGAARMNFLNDDSAGELCNHRSVTYAAGSPAPGAITFYVGDRPVRQCWYQFGGATLDLACDEHGLPANGTTPIRFTRAQAEPESSEAPSLVGDWKDGWIRFTFLPDGLCVVKDAPIHYKIVNAGELDLLWPQPERCKYAFRGKDELLLTCPSMSLDLRR